MLLPSIILLAVITYFVINLYMCNVAFIVSVSLLQQGLTIPPPLAPPTGATLPILLPKPTQLLPTTSENSGNTLASTTPSQETEPTTKPPNT